jgi:LytR cell envelope-related transcriptional attenuator
VATPPSLGSRPPLRTGGIALLGLGAVAAAMGLYTAATGGDGEGTLAQAPPSAVVAPTAEVVPPTLPAVVPPPPSAITAPSATAPFVTGDGDEASAAAQPSAAASSAAAEARAGAGASGNSTSSATRAPLRVYNNSTVTGLAARAAGDFRNAGWTVTEIGGFPGADLPTSTVYYRPGTNEEAAAQEIGRAFGLKVEPRFPAIEQASPGVIVIVTKEYRSPGPN